MEEERKTRVKDRERRRERKRASLGERERETTTTKALWGGGCHRRMSHGWAEEAIWQRGEMLWEMRDRGLRDSN